MSDSAASPSKGSSPSPGFRGLLRDTRGAGMVEYLILVGVIALAAQTAFRAFGKALTSVAREQGVTVGMLETGDAHECVGGLCTTRGDQKF
jgi:pilus assembly protein Flp/PilA